METGQNSIWPDLSVTRNADIDYGSAEDFPDLRSKMSPCSA